MRTAYIAVAIVSAAILTTVVFLSGRGDSRAQARADSSDHPTVTPETSIEGERNARPSTPGREVVLEEPARPPEPSVAAKTAQEEAPSPPEPDPREQDERATWEAEYADATADEIGAEIARLQSQTAQDQAKAAAERDAMGLFEIVPGGSITVGKNDVKSEIAVHLMSSNQELHKVALPEEEFPEFYETRRKINWLQAQKLLRTKD